MGDGWEDTGWNPVVSSQVTRALNQSKDQSSDKNGF